GSQHHLACASGPIRALEQRVEAVLAIEPDRYIRSLLRYARGDERDRASRSDVRFHRSARPCLGGRGKRGQDNQALGRSRGGFSTKIHLKTDFGGLPIAFHLTGGEASDSRNFETLLDIGPDLNPRAALGDKGYDSKSNRDAAPTRNMFGNPVSIQHQGYARLLSENTLQGAGTLRTSGRQAQTLQAYRTSMREDGAELRLVRRACSRLHLDQIRPHGLGLVTWRPELYSACRQQRRRTHPWHRGDL